MRIAEPDDVVMRLQRLEKPDDWPPELRDRILGTVPENFLQRYPDNVGFYRQLAAFIGVPEANLVVTSGIDEPIRSLMTLCCDPGDTIAVTWPGYAMYDVYARMFGVGLTPIIYDPYRFMEPEELLAKLDETTRILFLPNPSQPVENCFDLDQLRRIALHCRDHEILLAVDEAYHFFGAPTAQPLIDEFDNLLIMRTFSKAFGAASLRLGYVIGSPAAIGPLSAFRLAHEAGGLSLHAGSVLIDCFDSFVKEHIREACGGRDFLRQAISGECGLQTWGQVSNCVLIDMGSKDRMAAVNEALRAKGIYVKGGFPQPMDKYLLVTCGRKALMEQFFAAFREAFMSNS